MCSLYCSIATALHVHCAGKADYTAEENAARGKPKKATREGKAEGGE
jgi:hypothetical protein